MSGVVRAGKASTKRNNWTLKFLSFMDQSISLS